MKGINIVSLMIAAAVMFLYADVEAVTDFRIAGIELRSAYVMVEDPVDDTIALGGSVNLGNINTNTYLRVDLLYWKKSYSHPEFPGSYVYEWDYEDLAAKINIQYNVPFENIIPYLGAGFTIHNYTWDYAYNPYGWEVTGKKKTALGFQIFGGVQYSLPYNLYCFAEVAFDRSNRDQLFAGGGFGFNIK